MLDKCTEFLMRRYDPANPLLEWANQSNSSLLQEPVEVQKTSITLKELLVQVRDEMLASWGLNPDDRHLFADDIVAYATLQKCKEYNVIDMPKGSVA